MPTFSDDDIGRLEAQLIAQAPDGLSEAEFNAWLSSRMNQALTQGDKRSWTDVAVDALPMIGGSVGGMLGVAGGPAGVVGGAALGGASGEAWKQNINRLRGKKAPSSMGEAAKEITVSGAREGLTEAAGGVAGKALKKGGQAIYRGLLKPSVGVVAKYGDVVPGLVERGRLITPGGAKKARTAMLASKDAADALVAKASGATPYVTPADATKYFDDVEKVLKTRATAGQVDDLGKLAQRRTRIRSNMTAKTGVGLDVADANVLKREMDKAADAALKANRRGGVQLSADDLMDDAVRRGLKERIEDIAGTKAQNAMTRTLAGESTALSDAVRRSRNNLAVGGMRDLIAAGVGGSVAGPAGVSAGLLTRLLASPRAGSAIAIAMDRTGKKVPIDDVIRALEVLAQESEK